MNQSPEVSSVGIVILNYNSASDVMRLVKNLTDQRDSEKYHLILVDNASPDGSGELLRQQFSGGKDITVLLADSNQGYSVGNNIGLRYAVQIGCQYGLVVNPDMEFPQIDYIAELAAVLDRDSKVAVVGSDIWHIEQYHQNPLLPDGNWVDSLKWVVSVFFLKTSVPNFIGDYQRSHYCSKVSGCCFMIRLSFLESIGFFDEYPFLYCEEAILSKQVELAGMKIYYLANKQAIHRHLSQSKGSPVKRFQQWRRSRVYFCRRYWHDPWWGKWAAILAFDFYAWFFSGVYYIQKGWSIFKRN